MISTTVETQCSESGLQVATAGEDTWTNISIGCGHMS